MKYLVALIIFVSLLNESDAQTMYSDLDMWCGDIENEVDESTGGTKFYTPYDQPIYIKKIVTNGDIAFYITLNAIGPASNTGKGITIFLGHNYKIKKDIHTAVYQNEKGQFVHYATFRLNKNDISMLKNYIISGYEIYMYTSQIENTVKYQGYMYCLTKK
jgi:hypothetical protein